MPEYDGTYTLGVEIDTTQAKKELDNLAKDTTKSINNGGNVIEPTVDTKKLNAQVKKGLSQEPIDVKMNPQLVFGDKARKSQAEQQKTIDQIRKQEAALQSLDRAYMVSSQQSQLAIDAQRKKVEEYRNTIASIKKDTTYWAYNHSKDFKQVFDTYAQYENQLIELEEKAEELRSALAIHPEHELTRRELVDVEKEIDRIEGLSLDVTQQLNKWRTNPKLVPEIKKIYDTAEDETKKLEVMQDKATKGQGDYQAKRQGILDVIQSLTDTLTKQKGKAALAGENTVVGQLLGLLKGANGKGIKSIIDEISTALVALPEPITTTIGLVIKLAGVLGIITAALNVVKKILDGIFGVIKKIIGIALQLVKNALGKVLAKFKELTKRTNLFGTIFQRMFRKISTSLKRRLFYGVITRAIGNLRNALVNLIKTDDEVKKSIGQTKGNLMTAFAPIYSFILPAIQRLMSALVQLSAMLARITSGLFGKTTKQSAELAKSLEEQAKAGSSASQSLASFDKLNTISTSGGGDTIKPIYDLMSDLFKNSQLEQYVKRLRGILANLWAPFKRSWDKYGKTTWDKVKTTLATVLDLILDVGETFSKIWNFGGSGMGVGGHSGGYGDSILGHLWVSLQNILDGVTSLLESLGEAWAEYGEPISTNILRIVDTVSSHLENLTGRFKKWAKNIDFKPLLRGINDVVEALEPLADKVGEGLEQFANDVLFPLGNWLIEKGIPAVLRLTGDMIQRIANKIDVFNKVMGRVWDKYLSPFISNVGNDILYILNSAHVTLSILNSDTDATTFRFALLSGVIDGIITGFRTLKDMIIGLVGGPVVLLISKSINLHDAIRTVVDIIRNLIVGTHELIIILRQLSNGEIGAVASKLASAFSQIKSWAQDLYNKIIGWINGIIDAIGKVISRLGDGIAQFGAFGGAGGHVLQQLGEAVQAIDIATNPQPSKPSSSGSTPHINSASDYVEYKKKLSIKGHANGNVVPPNVAPYLAILGDNNKETEIVSPLSTMKQAMLEAMNEGGFSGGNGTIHIHLDVDGREIASVVKQQSDIYKKRTGRSLLV